MNLFIYCFKYFNPHLERMKMDEIKSAINLANESFDKKNFQQTIQFLDGVTKNKLLEKEQNKKFLGDIDFLYAKTFLALKKLDQALQSANKCMQFAANAKNFSLQSQTLRILGSIQSQKGNHIKSLELLRKSLQLEQKIGDKIGEGNALFELGLEEADGDDYKNSIEHLQHALKIFKKLNHDKEAKNVEKEIILAFQLSK